MTTTNLKNRLIALDADGVLLDYNRAYAKAWERAFGEVPVLRDPEAYWAIDRWGLERLEGERLERLRASFDVQYWSSIPAIDGAVDACRRLVNAGYDLVCVSALQPQFADARLANLRAHGFPIDRVFATSSATDGRSPKAAALEQLRPLAFVDDYLPYFKGVPQDMHTALVLRQQRGSPNVGPELANVKSTHADLAAFADWWLGR